MLKNILNLEGVTVLTKQQQKHVMGGGEVCKAVCKDGSTVGTDMCSNASISCSTSGGSSSCSCAEGPGPFDPPAKLTKAF